jgi:hypothetical protein
MRRKMVVRRWLQDVELLARLREPGCPVCAPINEERRSYFFWFFNENYCDPGVMERFVASFGFGLAHGARAAQYAAAASPLSYLYEYILHRTQRLIAQEIAGAARQSPLVAPLLCPTCESFQGSARRAAWFLAQLLHAPDVVACYGKPALLCFPHLCILAPHVTPEVLTHLFTMHIAELAAAAQAVAALRTAGTATTAPETPGVQQCIDAAMALLVDHGVDPAPLPPRDTPQDTQRLPDPLHDFAASLNRVDGCPVCFEVARATREWITWLDGAVVRDQNIADLLPICPEHIAACVRIGSAPLALAIMHNALQVTLERTAFAHRVLVPKESHGRWGARIRLKLEAPRQRLTAAVDLLQRPRDCPVCVRLATTQIRAIELLFALLEAPQHQAALERGHGLCMPHFSQALARVPNQALRTLLLRTQSAKLACLAWEVEEARRKAAWVGRPETPGVERTAWLRALYRFSGSWVPCV